MADAFIRTLGVVYKLCIGRVHRDRVWGRGVDNAARSAIPFDARLMSSLATNCLACPLVFAFRGAHSSAISQP